MRGTKEEEEGSMINRLKVGQRLFLGSAMLCVLAASVALIGYVQIQQLRVQLDGVPDMVGTRVMLSEWQGQTGTNAARAVAILKTSDSTLGETLAPEMKTTSENISVLQKRIESLKMSDEAKAAFAAVGEARKAYIAAREETLALKRQRSSEAAKVFDAKFYPALAAYELAVQSFVEGLETDSISRFELSKEESASAILWLAGCTVAFLVVAMILVVTMIRSITTPVQEAVQVAEALARGDLTRKIEARGNDEIGVLMGALASATAQLAVLVRGIQDSAASINGGAQEISHGNNQLSMRTESQASSLEETASSMEELTATVTHNAENASHANQLVQGASTVAVRGGEVVGQVVRTMGEISQSSRRIADITGIIDGIAFQTNILALNAAVEAARAGDQGRGFAVVASEVRSLAQRSATAAKEIKALIEESVGKVDAGTKLAADAGKTMDEVVAAVRKVAEITGEIKSASREQASGIQQVNQAVTQMDQVTQQNAALVEQVSAASASLQEQAAGLTRAVSAFRVDERVEVRLEANIDSPAELQAEAGLRLPEEERLALPAGAR
jgi:methyl-accepting chemotaxis protein